jgi:hypothetical protein
MKPVDVRLELIETPKGFIVRFGGEEHGPFPTKDKAWTFFNLMTRVASLVGGSLLPAKFNTEPSAYDMVQAELAALDRKAMN